MRKTINRSVEHWRSFSPTTRIAAVIIAAVIATALAYLLINYFQGLPNAARNPVQASVLTQSTRQAV